MAKDEKKKTKRPTAQKRDIRNSKQRLINKVFKSQVRTAMRSFEEALKGNDKEKIQQSLSSVYSMMDKGDLQAQQSRTRQSTHNPKSPRSFCLKIFFIKSPIMGFF
jgi:small subunit ribosomal protein S20